MRRSLALVPALCVACLDTQLLPNEHHCARRSGDQWCAEQHADGSRPYCSRGFCDGAPEPDSRPLDGCVAVRPSDDVCYSPCGGASSYTEDASCLSSTATTDPASTTDPEPTTTTGFPDPEPSCGDAFVDSDEICDDGDQNGLLGHCDVDCQGLTTGCGNAVVDPGEACDDGNPVVGDGCNPDCRESGAVVWERELLSTGFLRGIDIGPSGGVYLGGAVYGAPDRAWAARLDDRNGMLDWAYTLDTPPTSVLYDVFLTAHAADDGFVVFAGRHGDLAYAVTRDESGTFYEEAFDPGAEHIEEIVDIGTGYLAKRGELAVRYDYTLAEAWTTAVGAGLAYRPGDDVALAAPGSAASFRRFGLDGAALPPVEMPLPAGLAANSRFLAWTEDGDVIVAGLLTGPGAQDAFAFRSSPAGDLRWMYGTESLAAQVRQPLCLAVDDQGAVIVGGYAWLLASAHPYLMKLSPEGQPLWARSLELTSARGAIYGCAVNAAREIIAVGQTEDHLWMVKVTP